METTMTEAEPAVQPCQTEASAHEPLPVTVRLVTDYQAFVRLEPVWNRLAEEAGVDHPFLRHEWVRTWWESFEPEGRLYILLAMEGSDVIGLAPLMMDRGRVYGCPVRRLRGMANVYTERFDFIFSRRAKETCEAIWKFLAAHASEWDMLEFRQVPEGSCVGEHLGNFAMADRFLTGQWHSTDGPYIPIRQPWDAYVKSLSKKHVSNLRGRAKGLHRIGKVECEIVTGGEGLQQAVEEGLLLEAAAWKGQAGTAILNRPDRLTFYRHFLAQAAEKGWLRLHFLTLNGKRIAVQFTVQFREKLYILKSGYDPHYASFAPSLVLCELMLREAWNRHLLEIDFLGSAERWKLEWTHVTRAHSWLFVFPNRPRPRLLHRLKFSVVPRLQKNLAYQMLRMGGARLGLRAHDE